MMQKADKKQVEEFLRMIEELKIELNKLKELFQKLLKESKEHKEGIASLKSNIEVIESKLVNITKLIVELSAKIEKGHKPAASDKGQNIMAQPGNAHVDDEEWNEIKKSVEKLRKDVADIFKELDLLRDLKSRFAGFEAMLDAKLDKDEFEKWRLSSNIEQILSGLVKKFADRNEMLKVLKKLENRILVLEEMISKEGGPIDPGDNAMLAKKPLGGWSCASCQKEILNIEGFRVPYYPWAKLPQRNPAERIAKVCNWCFTLNRLDKAFHVCCQCSNRNSLLNLSK